MNGLSHRTLALAIGFVAIGFFPSFEAKDEFTSNILTGPWQFANSARAQSGPVGDIVGLEPGMDFDNIVSLIKQRDDVGPIEIAEQWIRQSHGVPTRQLLRAADGMACAQGEGAKRSGGHIRCNTFGKRFEARKDITDEIIVAFVGMPEHETAGSIWRFRMARTRPSRDWKRPWPRNTANPTSARPSPDTTARPTGQARPT